MRNTSGRRSTGRLIAIVVGLAVILLGAWLGSRLWRSALAPWSDSAGGNATLQGEWTGVVTLDDGTTGTLRMQLIDTVDEMEDFSSPNLEGTAHYCLGPSTGEFELIGHVTREGAIEWLQFQSYETAPAWLFHTDSGQYSGETLTLAGRYSFDPTGQHIARSDVPEPEVTLIMERAAQASANPGLCP